MGATQLLKSKLNFKYKADVVSLFVAMIVCPMWWFYNTPPAEIAEALSHGTIASVKFGMTQVMVAIATWFTATKSYDMALGNKKRQDKHNAEKEEIHTHNKTLSDRVVELENGKGSGGINELDDPSEVDNKLSDILEGRQ